MQYMAPELIRREPIDERIDIFAFGVLAFELLTDRLPYDATNSTTMMLQRINTEPLDPAVVKPKLSRSALRDPPEVDRTPEGPALGVDEQPRRSPAQRAGQAATGLIVFSPWVLSQVVEIRGCLG